jgi:SOS-response transcriptional repressor LexA
MKSNSKDSHRASPERVLTFVKAFWDEHSRSPKLREIAEEFGITSPAVEKHIRRLVEAGKLVRIKQPGLGGLQLLPTREPGALSSTTSMVPVLGGVTRHGFIQAQAEPIAHWHDTFEAYDVRNVFGLFALEDIPSCLIAVGDLLVFERARSAQPFQLCAFEHNLQLAFVMGWAFAAASSTGISVPESFAREAIDPGPIHGFADLAGSSGVFFSLSNDDEDFEVVKKFLRHEGGGRLGMTYVGPLIKVSRFNPKLSLSQLDRMPRHIVGRVPSS